MTQEKKEFGFDKTSNLTFREREQRYWDFVFSQKPKEQKQENKNLPAKITINSIVVGQSLSLPSAREFRQVRKMELAQIVTANYTNLAAYEKKQPNLGVNLAAAAALIVFNDWDIKASDKTILDVGQQIFDAHPRLSPEEVFYALDKINSQKVFKLTPKVMIDTIAVFQEQKTTIAAEASYNAHVQNKFYEPSDSEAAKEVEKALMREARIFELKSKSTKDNAEKKQGRQKD